MNGSDPKQTARDLLIEAHPALVGLSHWIHANPELGYQEFLASGWVADWMTTAGFDVRRNVAGLETALAASFGPGPFHVALCAEYDALPAVGHACGHNVISAAAVGAAIALAAVADELGLRVTLFGTPAEEGGGGKLVLIEAGEFDAVHAALMVHPGPDDIVEPELLGVRTLNVAYTGREAHAAGFPELGINAADALTVAQVAIGLLRQHLDSGDRVHGIVTKGGDAPNIVPAHTTASFMVRSRTRDGLEAITEKVIACFEAGAIASGAALEVKQEVAYSPMLHDPDLAALYRLNAEATGRWFDPSARMVVSTDMGDVSHVVPSIHPIIGIDSRPFVNHQPEFAKAAVAPAADQAIFDGALLLAWTVIDAATSDVIRERLTGMAWEPTRWVAEPAGEVEITYTETIVAADAWATPDEVAQAENAAEVAWAAEPPAAAPWEGATTADDVDRVAAAADPWSEPAAAPQVAADEWASPDSVTQAENASEVAWSTQSTTFLAWEGEDTADDIQPAAAAIAEPEPEPATMELAPEPEAVTEHEPGTEPAAMEPETETLGEPDAPASGDDYAAWEADFAAALENLDRTSTSHPD